jgi:hypothetical protein
MPTPSLNTRRLLQGFGSVADLQLALELHELPVPKAGTVRQWYSRKSMPVDWLAVLLTLSHRRGEPLNLLEFVEHE